MKLLERVMRRMGWVPTDDLQSSYSATRWAMGRLCEEQRAHAETKKKLKGIAALTPEQRSARTAKGNRTRALRREITSRPETKGAV